MYVKSWKVNSDGSTAETAVIVEDNAVMTEDITDCTEEVADFTEYAADTPEVVVFEVADNAVITAIITDFTEMVAVTAVIPPSNEERGDVFYTNITITVPKYFFSMAL